MAAKHEIVQFDELPSWTVKIGWDTAEGGWPALPVDAKVTMIAKLANGSSQIVAPAVVVDAATRTVRWDPTSSQTTAPGTYNVKWRVTYSNGKSQSHPGPGEFDTLTISPAASTTDVADPV